MKPSDLARFAAKVRFDPRTGCVIWIAGTSSGRAGEVRYGAFSYEGKRWPAHRWAAKFIHGLNLYPDKEAQQTCGNTLCVEHIRAGVHPSGNARQFWLLVDRGYDPRNEEPEAATAEVEEPADPGIVHEPPEWLRPFMEASDG